MKLSSLFRHFRFRTRYITIPTEVAEHPKSPLRGVARAKFRVFFVTSSGEVIDPDTWEPVDRVSLSNVRIESYAILLVHVGDDSVDNR